MPLTMKQQQVICLLKLGDLSVETLPFCILRAHPRKDGDCWPELIQMRYDKIYFPSFDGKEISTPGIPK